MGPTAAAVAAEEKPAARRPTTTTVASAVHRVQMALLDGAAASDEPLLHAAAALLSRADYADVVTERSIADACGYPSCASPLPDAPRGAPRFHISLREHRVYDLEEARKFCSERCLVASAALAASLPAQRPFGVPPDRLDAMVALFEGSAGCGSVLGFGAAASGGKGGGKDGEERRKKMEIREKEAPGPGEVTLQEWIGPSAAIEGYVPRRDRLGSEGPKKEAKQNNVGNAEGSREPSSVDSQVNPEVIAKKLDSMVLSENTKPKKEATKTPSKMFKQDEDNDMLSSCISDSIAKQLENVVLEEKNDRKKKKGTKAASRARKSKPAKRDINEVDFMSTIIIGDNHMPKMDQGTVGQYNFSSSVLAEEQPSSSQYAATDSMQAYTEQLHEVFSNAVNIEKDATSDDRVKHALKSSLKSVGSKSLSHSVKWADENGSVLEKSKAFESCSSDEKQSPESMDSSVRRASAEACAAALTEAAEAVSSGTSEVNDAASKAGIIILPDMLHEEQFRNNVDNAEDAGENEMFEIDTGVVKWPKKTVLLDTDMFEVDDSWHDTPPEGFSLTLSAFATMWTTLFGWISRSSLAYVYGLDESSVEDLLVANGREYPKKIVLNGGHSAEIRRALATCVCNALPVLVSNMRIQIPVSKLEITLGYLIDTMSFIDALPSLRSRQWQVMVLVLLDALSVHQLPALAPVIAESKLLQKHLNSAQISREEYDSMIDLFLPLGRSRQPPPTC